MKTVNVKDYGGIARAKGSGIIYCGRPSPLGNPCSMPNSPCPICEEIHFGIGMSELTPCRSIECYRKWLWNKIKKRDEKVIYELSRISEDSLLGCFCYPKTCHCDVVAKAWKYCKEFGII